MNSRLVTITKEIADNRGKRKQMERTITKGISQTYEKEKYSRKY